MKKHFGLVLFGTLLFSTLTIVGAANADGESLYNTKCLVCHGKAGASLVPTQPILSGQYADYLKKQTTMFRDNHRKNIIMTPMAAGLSDRDIDEISTYLSEQNPVIAGAKDETKAKLGETIYRIGVANTQIPACTACHGPTGAGIEPNYPRVSGQYALYVINSLKEYRSGNRKSTEMNTISAKLSDEQIENLAEYISGLAQ